MDPKERRKLMKAVGELLDLSEDAIAGPVQKIGGDGWQAYVYEPTSGKRTLHVEVKLPEAA